MGQSQSHSSSAAAPAAPAPSSPAPAPAPAALPGRKRAAVAWWLDWSVPRVLERPSAEGERPLKRARRSAGEEREEAEVDTLLLDRGEAGSETSRSVQAPASIDAVVVSESRPLPPVSLDADTALPAHPSSLGPPLISSSTPLPPPPTTPPQLEGGEVVAAQQREEGELTPSPPPSRAASLQPAPAPSTSSGAGKRPSEPHTEDREPSTSITRPLTDPAPALARTASLDALMAAPLADSCPLAERIVPQAGPSRPSKPHPKTKAKSTKADAEDGDPTWWYRSRSSSASPPPPTAAPPPPRPSTSSAAAAHPSNKTSLLTRIEMASSSAHRPSSFRRSRSPSPPPGADLTTGPSLIQRLGLEPPSLAPQHSRSRSRSPPSSLPPAPGRSLLDRMQGPSQGPSLLQRMGMPEGGPPRGRGKGKWKGRGGGGGRGRGAWGKGERGKGK